MVRFFLALLFSAGIISLAVYLGANMGYFGWPTFFGKTLGLLFFTTAILYVYLHKAERPQFFVQLYLLTMVLKVLLYCGYVFIMVLDDRVSGTENVVFFMAVYLTFTLVEIAFLYRKITGAGNR